MGIDTVRVVVWTSQFVRTRVMLIRAGPRPGARREDTEIMSQGV